MSSYVDCLMIRFTCETFRYLIIWKVNNLGSSPIRSLGQNEVVVKGFSWPVHF
jgi:hypothetical protein